MRNIWDVVPARDAWERGYAHLEFLRTEVKQVFSIRIEVKNG